MVRQGLEEGLKDAILVYPGQKYRWDGDGGWALGPEAGDYGGGEDIRFTAELLDLIERDYTVDRARIFATGHSSGGDMAAVVGCFLGDRFRALAPIAANRPYWLGTPPSAAACRGRPAVWTIFGLNDDHFGATSPDGAFGIEQNTF